jgi:hypothetical protein
MASPHSFHERADPVSDTVDSLFRLRPPPSTYAFCSLAASFDSMVKMAS